MRYTVITGASSGIGCEASRAFAGRGKNLVLAARRGERLTALKKEILREHPELDIIVRVSDLSLPENARRLYASLSGYPLETWVNNAGFGNYASVARQDLDTTEAMLRLNVETLTLLSSLFVRDYKDVPGTQLINVSSAGGYTMVPNAVTYCAAKFYVSAFTEGLAEELRDAEIKVKVLAPAAAETEFGMRANDVPQYDYNKAFGTYHTARQMAAFLLELYDSDATVGIVDRESFRFSLRGPLFPSAGGSGKNQRFGQ